MARWGSRRNATAKEAAAAATLSSFFSAGSSGSVASREKSDTRPFSAMSMKERWQAALKKQQANAIPEWLCSKCHTTNFMKKSICRGCAHQKGWILLPKGEPPSGPALPVPMLPGGRHPNRDISQASEPSSGISTVPVEPRPKKAPTPMPPLLLKQEETKLLTLRQQTVDAGLPTDAIDTKLEQLRAANAPVVKVPAQALMEATTHHRRCTQAREKAQAALALAHKTLAEAEETLKQRHIEEEKALQDEDAARQRVMDMPSAPTIPITILHNTARTLHQELAVAPTLPSVDQLILALGHIMEKQWSLHSATAAPATPSILHEASKREEEDG